MESVTLKVVTDDTTDIIGKGIALPKGAYPGVVEWRTLGLGGHLTSYLAIAKLFLSSEQLNALGVQTTALGVWSTVTGHVKSGKIQIAEISETTLP